MKKILPDTNILIYSIDKESLYHIKSYEIVNNKQYNFRDISEIKIVIP